jgi:hypothetical protein
MAERGGERLGFQAFFLLLVLAKAASLAPPKSRPAASYPEIGTYGQRVRPRPMSPTATLELGQSTHIPKWSERTAPAHRRPHSRRSFRQPSNRLSDVNGSPCPYASASARHRKQSRVPGGTAQRQRRDHYRGGRLPLPALRLTRAEPLAILRVVCRTSSGRRIRGTSFGSKRSLAAFCHCRAARS